MRRVYNPLTQMDRLRLILIIGLLNKFDAIYKFHLEFSVFATL